ncbi:Guanine-hypoxanthine permease [Streptococcus sp. HSISM1]|nr:Guanine-hypoxanthine permease [Streptococcus sp. HSISM1]
MIVVGDHDVEWLENIHWEDMSEAVPAFFTSIFMGFSYSITQGIAAGFITYSLVKVVKGEAKEVHSMIWILDVLFILNYVSMALN